MGTSSIEGCPGSSVAAGRKHVAKAHMLTYLQPARTTAQRTATMVRALTAAREVCAPLNCEDGHLLTRTQSRAEKAAAVDEAEVAVVDVEELHATTVTATLA